jgi:hypothetical protein
VREIAARVHKEIVGRVADSVDSLVNTGQYLRKGDHLEIGTLFGGSAIFAALVKQDPELAGKVVCIDPLDGYYNNHPKGGPIDKGTGLSPSRELVEQNAEHFGVELEIVQALSDPFPLQLMGRVFSTAYIDGDHWGDMPSRDWRNVKDIVTDFVIFDNYDRRHPAVRMAAENAAADPGWEFVQKTDISYIVAKVR